MTDIAAEEIETAIKNKDLKYYEIGAITNYIGRYLIPTIMTAYGAIATKRTIEKITKNGVQNFIKKTKTTNTNPNYIIKNKNGEYVNLRTGEIFDRKF